MPLVRKVRAGNRVTIGDVILDCVKTGGSTLRLIITAPDNVAIHVAPLGEESALHPPHNRAPVGA